MDWKQETLRLEARITQNGNEKLVDWNQETRRLEKWDIGHMLLGGLYYFIARELLRAHTLI